MLRIFLWRLTFEVLHLFKALGFRGPNVSYFAYGGNLDPEVMKNRGMSIKASLPATLSGFVFKFNHEVPFIGVGMASIEKSSERSVYGVLYTLPKIDEWIMDCYESCTVLGRYRKGAVEVAGKNCFYYYSGRPSEGLLPFRNYLQKIINGYKKILPADSDFIQQLENRPTVPVMVPKSPPRFLITNYNKFGGFLRPVLEKYDGLCVKVFVYYVFRPSLFRRWIK